MSVTQNPENCVAKVAVITARVPKRLTKRFRLEDGKPRKESGGALVDGQVDVHEISSHRALADLIVGLQHSQALVYGLPRIVPARVLTKEKWNEDGQPPGTIPRTEEHFPWADGPAVMMFDYDPRPGTPALSRQELVGMLRRVVPGLANVAMTWIPSASSHIVNSDTDEDLTGLRGQRLYVLVKNGRDIERAGVAIVRHLWAADLGHIQVSSSGSLLERTIFDASVWQSNRLDFAAGAMCEPPLGQQRGEPEPIPGEIEFADTTALVPDPTQAEIDRADAARQKAKEAAADEAAKARQKWIADRVNEMVRGDTDPDALIAARAQAEKAVDGGVLSGGFPIQVVQGRQHVTVSVEKILADPPKYHGSITLDPLEPDYQGEKAVGKLYTLGAGARLYSFAHGGQTFTLERQPVRIEVAEGKSAEATQQAMDLLRASPQFYELGDSLVIVDGGRLHPLDEHSLAFHLAHLVQFTKPPTGRKINSGPVPTNPPKDIVKQILSPGVGGGLKPLDALVTAPTIKLDGAILDAPGYDAETRLYLDLPDDLPKVQDNPTMEQVKQAVDTLMFAFKDFPYAGPIDSGVVLAALLTAVVRPVLRTAPAFAIDAPVQSSGKTLLASCICALATGGKPTVMPPVTGEETRKRLLAVLRQGERGIVWDNVTEPLDDDSMAMLLTSDTFSDRVLGVTAMITVPNRAIILITGNNLQFSGDMPRRVLTCRIDPRTDEPFTREFDLDPLQYVLKHRQKLVAAALTIIRGYRCSGAARAKGKMGSFEDFDALVRQPVAWVGACVMPGEFADPIESTRQAQTVDPEREAIGALLRGWRAMVFFDQWQTAKDVWAELQRCRKKYETEPHPSNDVTASLCAFGGDKATQSAQTLGKTLSRVKMRVVDDLRLENKYDSHKKIQMWRVAWVFGSAAGPPDDLDEGEVQEDFPF